jgi:hypothetical protein
VKRAAVGLDVLGLALPALGRRRRATHENPHAEVTATARVDAAPLRTRHSNGREFEEFRVRIVSVDPGASVPDFPFDTRGSVLVFHDLTCGGAWLELAPGDRIDIRGEYVHTPNGRDLIHFTHPANGSCGRASGHPDGFLRPHREAAAAQDRGSDPAGELPAGAASLAQFRAAVRPILSTRCAPCHEPGGKMYARLPFDDPATVSGHAERMATRLSGDGRRILLEWATASAPAPAR